MRIRLIEAEGLRADLHSILKCLIAMKPSNPELSRIMGSRLDQVKIRLTTALVSGVSG